jgi:hypothetical protein
MLSGAISSISLLSLTVFFKRFHYFLDLGKYKEFFKLLLEEILVKCLKQKLYVVELRHIFGLLFDEDRQPVQLQEELHLI